MGNKTFSRIDDILSGHASEKLVDACLVLEGGAFRGLYGEGVLDYWMQNDMNFSCVIGVSAGALNGLNYVSGQIGRAARANLNSRYDRNYIGGGAIRKSHSLINLNYLFRDYNHIEPFDLNRFNRPQQRFIVVATDCRSGETLYFEKGKCRDIFTAAKASASMPVISPMVNVDGTPCLDGGCSCKIAYHWALDEGFEKIIVVRTRERGYRKRLSDKAIALSEKLYKHYPEFTEVLRRSDLDYNRQCRELEELEKEGRIFMIAPSRPVTVSRVEKDLEKLGELYELGVNDAIAEMDRLKAYLEK